MPAEAVLAALNALLKAIAPLKLPAAVLGGLALAIWKHPRFTKDVDVLIALGDVEPDTLVNVLKDAGFRQKCHNGILQVGTLKILQIIYEPAGALVDVQVDLLIADNQYQLEALGRRVRTSIPDFDTPIDVLACEDVLLHKLIAGRMIDLADAAALFRANRASLDFDHLLRWVDQHALGSEFRQVWIEAFPGEPLPEFPK